MKINENGINLIKKFEGFSSKPYLCPAKVATIGYGATSYEDGRKVKLTDKPITEEEALRLLKAQLKNYENAVNRYVVTEISDNQFSALVSFAYNVGISALQKSTLLKKVNINPNDHTIADEFFKWRYGGGRELLGLKKRRIEESNLYFKN